MLINRELCLLVRITLLGGGEGKGGGGRGEEGGGWGWPGKGQIILPLVIDCSGKARIQRKRKLWSLVGFVSRLVHFGPTT